MPIARCKNIKWKDEYQTFLDLETYRWPTLVYGSLSTSSEFIFIEISTLDFDIEISICVSNSFYFFTSIEIPIIKDTILFSGDDLLKGKIHLKDAVFDIKYPSRITIGNRIKINVNKVHLKLSDNYFSSLWGSFIIMLL